MDNPGPGSLSHSSVGWSSNAVFPSGLICRLFWQSKNISDRSIIKQAWRPRSQQLTNSLLEFWRFTVVSVLNQWRTCCTQSESFRNWTKQDLPFTIWSDPMPLGLVWLHYGILRFRIQTVCNAYEEHTYLIIFEYLMHLCPQLMYILNYVYT